MPIFQKKLLLQLLRYCLYSQSERLYNLEKETTKTNLILGRFYKRTFLKTSFLSQVKQILLHLVQVKCFWQNKRRNMLNEV